LYGELGVSVLREDAVSERVDFVGGVIGDENLGVVDNIENRDEYETVVLIDSTSFLDGDFGVFSYVGAGVLRDFIRVDERLVSRLVGSNVVKNMGEIGKDSRWNCDFVKRIGKKFPYARFVLISINEDSPSFVSEIVGYMISNYSDKNTAVFALVDGTFSDDGNVKKFQEKFVFDVFNNGLIFKFKDLPCKKVVQAMVVGNFIKYKKLVHLNFFDVDGLSAFFVQGEKSSLNNNVHFVFFGDVMLGRYVYVLMDKFGLDYPFKKMDWSYLAVNDGLIANLEGPVTNKAVKTSTGMNFGFFPKVVPVLKKYSFDMVSQANNHTFDKGDKAFEDSFEFLRKGGILPFGNPNSISDDFTLYRIVNGVKFAFIGFEEVNTKIDDTQAVEVIKKAKDKGYNVIVVPHFGIEYKHKPNKRQVELAHKFIDAGAIMVIGHHPHVVSTFENYNGHPIFYSLGNAIFDQYWSSDTQVGLSVGVSIMPNDDKTNIEVYLIPIKLPKSQFQLMDKEERDAFLIKFASWGDYSEDVKEDILNGKVVFSF